MSSANGLRRAFIALALILSLTALACDRNEQARVTFETAEFEELQNNPEHASKLYEEVIKDYPDTEYARKAKAKLDAMKSKEAQPTPPNSPK